jgi:hypothetical protein
MGNEQKSLLTESKWRTYLDALKSRKRCWV